MTHTSEYAYNLTVRPMSYTWHPI